MHKSVIIKIIQTGRAEEDCGRSGGTNEKVMNESIARARGRDGAAEGAGLIPQEGLLGVL